MKRLLLLTLAALAVGCTSSKPSTTAMTTTPTTELAGTWNVTGSGKTTTSTASGTFQATLVASPCTVATPLGTFSVAGTVCFMANNNSGVGALTGADITSAVPNKNLGQGILIGAAADPVPDNATINMVFVSAYNGGKTFQEFTGTATIVSGKMTGSGACSTASTANCVGASATFTASH